MLSPSDARGALHKLFHKRKIVDLPSLFRTLQTRSSMSVFRRLSEIGYISSYSHRGKYYTLPDIPAFDPLGLWQFQGVCFSRLGSLKRTTEHLVALSEAGYTHQELQFRLRIRVHNTLLDLLRSKRICRESLSDCFVYVSKLIRRAATQVARRRRLLALPPPPSVTAARPLVIEVLLEIIHGARIVADPGHVATRLIQRGVPVTRSQVEAIFREHGLKKTPRSPSRS
jgi:hypothetical protein